MGELEEKLNSVLNNPQMMQQIMSMAQNFNSSPVSKTDSASEAANIGELDLGMLQKLSTLAQQGRIDSNQQALLKALTPYLSRDRVSKLEKAMRAAKIAQMASGFLNTGHPQLQTGR